VVKLGILVSHPIQYLVPVYRALAQVPGLDLTVVYHARRGLDAYFDEGFKQTVKWDIPLLDGYKSDFLSSKDVQIRFAPGILSELWRRRFDVLIVHGYNQPTNVVGIMTAKALGTRVMLRGDTRIQRRHGSAKNVLKRLLFKALDGFLTVGTLNREYYSALGVGPDRLFHAPFCVANATFAIEPGDREVRRRRWREQFGVPQESVVALFAAKLSAYKRPGDLLEAFSRIRQLYPTAWLVVAGSGAEEEILRATAGDRVRFVGFQNQSVLPDLYAASDCFILPSDEEPWGLVINEVMAAGLPVIVSDGVGAAPDLVDGKGTGLIYPCGNVSALSEALDRLIRDVRLRSEMGERARQLIREWDVDVCVERTVAAVCRVAEGRGGEIGSSENARLLN